MPRIFDVKAARNIDKANSKIFPSKFASLPFIVAGKLFCTRILLVRQLFFTVKELIFSLLFK